MWSAVYEHEKVGRIWWSQQNIIVARTLNQFNRARVYVDSLIGVNGRALRVSGDAQNTAMDLGRCNSKTVKREREREREREAMPKNRRCL